MLPKTPCRALVSSLLVAAILTGSIIWAAPEPKNFLFEYADNEMTTDNPATERVTSMEYLLTGDENNDLTGGESLIAQPSEPAESIIASASSASSTSSTSNSIGGSSGKSTASNQPSNLVLLQQLQQQLQRQQLLQNKLQQVQVQQPGQQQQQPQFSLDALVKSFVKVFQVAKTKIDQGARTVRDILQFFDRKKYTTILPSGSENNLVLT